MTGLGNPWRAPHPISALPPRRSFLEASPKAISGRTSYLRVRLEFLRYPHLIPAFFNMRGFGPPVRVTAPSPWTGVDHPVSGLSPRTKSPYSDSVSLRLPYTVKLATKRKSLTHYTKGTQSPHEGAPTACTHTVSGSISLRSPRFFSPFPHGTGSLSVGQEYLALEDGPPMFRQGFTCPALLTFIMQALSHTGLSPSMAGLSRPFR